jgi:hypothetical protein
MFSIKSKIRKRKVRSVIVTCMVLTMLVSMFVFTPNVNASPITQTRIIQNHEETINGLYAENLSSSGESGAATWHTDNAIASVELEIVTFKMSVSVRHADESETALTNGYADIQVSTPTDPTFDGELSTVWACPSTVLVSTDAIVIRVQDGYGVDMLYAGAAVTEQLGANLLNAGSWTIVFYVHAEQYFNNENDYGTSWIFYYDGGKDSRIENFSYSITRLITVNSAYGNPTASATVDVGDNFDTSVTSPVSGGTGIQYVCTGYSIDGGGLTAGTNYTFTNVQTDHTITYSWKTQYYLTVTTSQSTQTGQGWYDSGATAYAGVAASPISGSTGIQYVFTSWSTGGTNYAQSTAITNPKLSYSDI